MFRFTVIMLFVLMPLAFAVAQEIDNGIVSVAWNEETQTVSLARSGKEFAKSVLPAGKGNAVIAEGQMPGSIANPLQGKSLHFRSIRAVYSVYDGIPFVFIHHSLSNETFGIGPDKSHAIKNFEFPVIETTLAADKIKTLGTAGLRDADKHKGSYMFLAAAQPEDRSGIVSGWVTSDMGSGIVFSGKEDNGNTVIRPVIEYGKRTPPANIAFGSNISYWKTETFVIGWFDDCRGGLEQYAEQAALANQVKIKNPLAGYCTWYADKNGGACNENAIIELAAAAEQLKPFGFNFVQIDDGWQDGISKNGPRKNFTRVKPEGAYKGGMKPVAEKITAKGMTAGIWLIPFAGSDEDPFWNKDFFLKSSVTDPVNDKGQVQRPNKFIANKENEPYKARWSGTCLDLSNPAVQEYLSSEIKTLTQDWGYKYLKLDGYHTGLGVDNIYVNNEYKVDDFGEAIYSNPDYTPVMTQRKGGKIIRQAAGEDTFLLGCCIAQNMRSFGAGFGQVDAMRIGPDNGASWGGLKTGPWHGTNRYFLNGRVWWNDPDPVYVRNSIPLSHAQLITSWVAVSGQLYAFSDWIPNLSEERLNVLKRTIRPHGLTTARPVDLFEKDFPQIWHLTNNISGRTSAPVNSRHIIAFYNWDDKQPCKIETTVEKIGLPKAERYAAFDFWGDKLFGEFTDKIETELPAGSCLVLAVRNIEKQPFVLSTSQHITQGIVDIVEEKWNAETKTLSGVSKVIANDPYELRIYDPAAKEIRRETFYPKETSDSFKWKAGF